MFTPLEQREVFHLAFLRQLARVLRPNSYAIKGGVNLRFFFGSIRYSEDMDLDVKGVQTFRLKEVVTGILESKGLNTTLRPYGVDRIIPPDMKVAKQTETTQRFKVHLITASAEDLFTKIEFSRRGLDSAVATEAVDSSVLRHYKHAPFLVSHYPPSVAIAQKINALASRTETQARDVFDLFMLLGRFEDSKKAVTNLSASILKKALNNLSSLGFDMFKDAVLNYLMEEDRRMYENKKAWEEIQTHVGQAIEGLLKP